MTNPKFSKTNLVTVTRNVKQSLNCDPNIWGPMPLDEAIKSGHLTTSGGTVSVRIAAHGGEFDGANVYCDANGVYRIQQ